ncbi:MAG: MoaD/ThiS family protein [Pseudobdellovibrio sp.]
MPKFILGSAFHKLTGGKKQIEVESLILSDALIELDLNYPGLKNKIIGDSNQILKYVSIFIGKEDVKYLDGLKTKMQPMDQISVLVAIAGG